MDLSNVGIWKVDWRVEGCCAGVWVVEEAWGGGYRVLGDWSAEVALFKYRLALRRSLSMTEWSSFSEASASASCVLRRLSSFASAISMSVPRTNSANFSGGNLHGFVGDFGYDICDGCWQAFGTANRPFFGSSRSSFCSSWACFSFVSLTRTMMLSSCTLYPDSAAAAAV